LKLSRLNKKARWLLFAVLICSAACSHTGSTCCDYNQVFRGQWDDFYLRALSCIETSNFQQALSDFQSSIERRPPSKQYDRRMVRTYGMHYLDYFPYRETGFIYYLQHQYVKALDYLNRSIQSEPSAKAYYYRNQIQKKIQTSTSQPVLTLSEPFEMMQDHDEIWQSKNDILIQGTAYDSVLIEEITIQKRQIWIDYGKKKIAFFKRYVFEEGRHDIHIQVKNICGAMVKKQIIFHVDQTGPSISIKKGTQPDTININAQDLSGQLALIIDDKQVLSVKQSALNYSLKWPSEKNSIYVCVKDRCQNQTCATVSHAQLFHHPQISGLIADNQTNAQSDLGFSSIHPISDYLTIDFDQNYPSPVFHEQINVSGKISANRQIVSVMINDKQLPIQASKHIYFSRQVCLDVGQNQVNIFAKTISGHLQKKTIHVYRKIQSVLQLHERYGLSMYPFQVNGQDQKSWLSNLIKRTSEADQDAFALAESFEKNFLKTLLKGHRFRINYRGQSLRKASGSIPFQGSLLGDAYVSKYGLEISARIIDNQTSAVLGIKDVYRESKGKIEIQPMAQELSDKIHQSFPLIRGKIISQMDHGYRLECQTSLPAVAWPILVYRKKPDADTKIIGNGRLSPGNHLNRQGMIVIDYGEASCGDWVISR